LPQQDEPHKQLAVTKVVGLSLALLLGGVVVFARARSRAARSASA
jgi:hypothetical protein